MQPAASDVQLVTDDRVYGMQRRRSDGLFEATLPFDGRAEDFAYRFRVREGTVTRDIIDPYQFGQVLTDFDLHLFGEGTHYRAWEKLGAHRLTRSEERRVGKSVDLGGRRIIKKKKRKREIDEKRKGNNRAHR